MMFLLRCPKCKHTMKYDSRDNVIVGKKKSCVYCGRSYIVKNAIVKKL